MAAVRAWFSFAEGDKYDGSAPAFFDVSDRRWKKLLEDNYQAIRGELQRLIENKEANIIPYFNETLASSPTSWTIFPLKMWGRSYEENCSKVPETTRIIGQIKGLTSCSFSILKPHTTIKPHHGDSDVMYRCHLTLKSPGGLPQIGMRVNGQEIGWIEGKLFAFCDAHKHKVWNNTDEERWVLILDILRDEFVQEEERICRLVNATLWWQLKFQKFYLIGHLPRFSRRWLMKLTALFMKRTN